MVKSRGPEDALKQAVALMEQALAVIDRESDLNLIGARLQEALDAARDLLRDSSGHE